MPCDFRPKPNTIGQVRNAMMTDRCHTNSKPDARNLECEDTDTARGEILGK